jgi:hypothetical protein
MTIDLHLVSMCFLYICVLEARNPLSWLVITWSTWYPPFLSCHHMRVVLTWASRHTCRASEVPSLITWYELSSVFFASRFSLWWHHILNVYHDIIWANEKKQHMCLEVTELSSRWHGLLIGYLLSSTNFTWESWRPHSCPLHGPAPC